jgi:fumarate reductase subunit C
VSEPAPVRYTPYHPKWYRRPVSVWWWLESWRYTRFVLRELTSVPVGFFALVTLWQIAALGQGPEAYARFQAAMRTPLFLTLHLLSLFALFFHALTWFHLAPKALTLRLGGKKVADSVIVFLNYAAWIAVSAAVAWIWLR